MAHRVVGGFQAHERIAWQRRSVLTAHLGTTLKPGLAYFSQVPSTRGGGIGAV